MSTHDQSLHLIQLDVEIGSLVRRAKARGLRLQDVDDGYLLHSWLDEVFGPGALRPFAVIGQFERTVRVLGYSRKDGEALQEEARLYSSPSNHEAGRWSSMASKPMPSAWRAGQRLGFGLRAAASVRQRSREVDAFLARVDQVGPDEPLSRESVYREWLEAALRRQGGARLVSVELESFQLARLLRRTQGERRRARRITLPDVRFAGVLEVVDPALFSALLARGVGRHRAFGFGMLLLRRPPC
jgi:CRISPR system Cascade subunit CasE